MWRKLTPPLLAALSALVNVYWVSMPFSWYGLGGRPAVLYGRYTLIETFLFPHWIGYIWAGGFVLQAIGACALAFQLESHRSLVAVIVCFSGAFVLASVSVMLIFLWALLELWRMYLLDFLSAALLAAPGGARVRWRDL